jgi:hypothetical protein
MLSFPFTVTLTRPALSGDWSGSRKRAGMGYDYGGIPRKIGFVFPWVEG